MAKQDQKQQLGKGLRALLNNIEAEVAQNNQEQVIKELSSAVANIPIHEIEVNPFQPRKDFDEEALQELADSIKTYGLIQPITLRRLDRNTYQLISGERRLRASKKAGLAEIPAYVRIANDEEMLEMALVENIQRENLNAIEIASTYQRLIEEFNLTHEKLSDRVGKRRSTVTNYLNLLKLPPANSTRLERMEKSLRDNAKVLNGVEDFGVQLALYHETVTHQCSVRELEKKVEQWRAEKVK
ncbi:MAG: ParB/RepB/Spo0J family partition protein, partial [Saprospiraceae bacterium]|nr:ParB/RepB/Spo0J family partition protein [Saprospiraceae bacterium]